MDISFLERLFDRLLDFLERAAVPDTLVQGRGAAFNTCLSNKLFIFDNSILKRKFKISNVPKDSSFSFTTKFL
jgi:hypothetical protein